MNRQSLYIFGGALLAVTALSMFAASSELSRAGPAVVAIEEVTAPAAVVAAPAIAIAIRNVGLSTDANVFKRKTVKFSPAIMIQKAVFYTAPRGGAAVRLIT